MIGSEKLLPVLAVPAEHQGHPLQLNDVKVVGVNVRSGWTAKTASEALDGSIEAVGKKPSYIISDNDSKMRKAVGLSNYTWHRDISHTLAMFMERVYKDDADFVDFNKKMATCKQQHCMREAAYLQSPSQRTKARFMNLSECVRWADKMLRIFHKLGRREQEVFSFLRPYASFVDEMKEMVSCIQFIETRMKHNGLSKNTIAECRRHVCATVMCGNDRMRRVGQQILDYLAKEKLLLKDNETVNNSSDIIESTTIMSKNAYAGRRLWTSISGEMKISWRTLLQNASGPSKQHKKTVSRQMSILNTLPFGASLIVALLPGVSTPVCGLSHLRCLFSGQQ